MKIMLDLSPARIRELSDKYRYEFWQLRTPLTEYARAEGIPYGLDNGCFKKFHEKIWWRLVEKAEYDHPVFITLPDIVGDAQRTIELFDIYKRKLWGMPIALVLQDGIDRVRIPWDEIHAVFIGGSDRFKTCEKTVAAARTAKMLGKWVHVGRVNTAQRALFWKDLADSCDGSGMSRFTPDLEQVLSALHFDDMQQELYLEE